MVPRFARVSMALAVGTALCASALGAQESTQDRRPGVAVLPFLNGGSHGADAEAGDFSGLEVGLQEMLGTELSNSSDLRIIERGRMNEIMKELDLSEGGRVDPETAVRIGRLVGARYVVLGTFTDLFGQFRMDAHVVDSETSEYMRARMVRDRREKIYDLLVDLSNQIIDDLHLPALPEAVVKEHKAREIPFEAVNLFSRAKVFEDAGRTDQAIELYRRLTNEFPDMVQAKQALQQITGETGL